MLVRSLSITFTSSQLSCVNTYIEEGAKLFSGSVLRARHKAEIC